MLASDKQPYTHTHTHKTKKRKKKERKPQKTLLLAPMEYLTLSRNAHTVSTMPFILNIPQDNCDNLYWPVYKLVKSSGTSSENNDFHI